MTQTFHLLDNLLPHQSALLDQFFDPATKRIVVLRAEVGLGKGTASVALAARLLRERPGARVLFITPAALRQQVAATCNLSNTPVLIVDRYRFRELLDSTSSPDIWPRGIVNVVSSDFARLPDVQESLASAKWDLIIADEVRSGPNAKTRLIQMLSRSASRMLLATGPLPYWPALELPEEPTVVEWRRSLMVDGAGRPLLASPLFIRELAFDFSDAELSLADHVDAVCQLLDVGTRAQGFLAQVIRNSFRSSMAALEASLQRLVSRDAPQPETVGFQADDEISEPPHDSDVLARDERHTSSPELTHLVSEVLVALDAIPIDSKLTSARLLLEDLLADRNNAKRICIVVDFVSTLYYVAEDLESRALRFVLFSSSMSLEERYTALQRFAVEGNILLTTRAIVEGADLQYVSDVILYDIPRNPLSLDQLIGRFDRFGRQLPLTIHALYPMNRLDQHTSDGLALLRSRIAGGPKQK